MAQKLLLRLGEVLSGIVLPDDAIPNLEQQRECAHDVKATLTSLFIVRFPKTSRSSQSKHRGRCYGGCHTVTIWREKHNLRKGGQRLVLGEHVAQRTSSIGAEFVAAQTAK